MKEKQLPKTLDEWKEYFVGYFKNIALFKAYIGSMLEKCGINFSNEINFGTDSFLIGGETITPNGGICVHFDGGLPCYIITPLGRLILSYPKLGLVGLTAAQRKEKVGRFRDLFKDEFWAERTTPAYESVFGDSWEGPRFLIKRLPWQKEHRLKNYKLDNSENSDFAKIRNHSVEILDYVYKTLNEQFEKEGLNLVAKPEYEFVNSQQI